MKCKRSMWKLAIATVVASGFLFGNRPVFAQATSARPGQGNAELAVTENKDEAPRFYGLHFDLSIFDGSGLNSVGENYRNDLSFYFEPSWDVGKTFSALRHTRWKTLQLAARFVVTANLPRAPTRTRSRATSTTGPQGTCGTPEHLGQRRRPRPRLGQLLQPGERHPPRGLLGLLAHAPAPSLSL